MARIIRLLFYTVLLAGLGHAAAAAPVGALLRIEGPIGPATSGYFDKAYGQALDAGAPFVVLEMDTPGGLDGPMRDIIKTILASPVPVIGYVAPSGARAASAGTYILYATHVAAMAPATEIGAATPIPAGGDWPAPDDDREKPGKPKPGDTDTGPPAADGAGNAEGPTAPGRDGRSAGEIKAVNDAVAYIRSLAELRGRNADWAEEAVRLGASVTAAEALRLKAIEIVAADRETLLRELDGRRFELANGPVTLRTAGSTLQPYTPDWRMQLLAVITSPTVAYLLLLAGIYGLLLEGYSPGATFPGVAGGISLLLGLYAMQLLPVNYAGLGLILLGVVLMVAEAMAPTFGALGFGGILAFVLGSVFLMDTGVPGYDINLGVILGCALSGAGVFALMAYMLWRSRRTPTMTGSDHMAGQIVQVLEPTIDGESWGKVQGERWRVRSRAPLAAGEKARVTGREGLVLIVEPLSPSEASP